MKYTLRMLRASKSWTQAQPQKKLAYLLKLGETKSVSDLIQMYQTYLR